MFLTLHPFEHPDALNWFVQLLCSLNTVLDTILVIHKMHVLCDPMLSATQDIGDYFCYKTT